MARIEGHYRSATSKWVPTAALPTDQAAEPSTVECQSGLFVIGNLVNSKDDSRLGANPEPGGVS